MNRYLPQIMNNNTNKRRQNYGNIFRTVWVRMGDSLLKWKELYTV